MSSFYSSLKGPSKVLKRNLKFHVILASDPSLFKSYSKLPKHVAKDEDQLLSFLSTEFSSLSTLHNDTQSSSNIHIVSMSVVTRNGVIPFEGKKTFKRGNVLVCFEEGRLGAELQHHLYHVNPHSFETLGPVLSSFQIYSQLFTMDKSSSPQTSHCEFVQAQGDKERERVLRTIKQLKENAIKSLAETKQVSLLSLKVSASQISITA
jgi:hypothetical protein